MITIQNDVGHARTVNLLPNGQPVCRRSGTKYYKFQACEYIAGKFSVTVTEIETDDSFQLARRDASKIRRYGTDRLEEWLVKLINNDWPIPSVGDADGSSTGVEPITEDVFKDVLMDHLRKIAAGYVPEQ